jgi:hypothetical protein
VLEAMTAFEESSKLGRFVQLETPYTRQPAMIDDPVPGILDG